MSYLWGFQRLKRTREMYFGKVYGGVLHSLQLRSKHCIQFIVRPHHPRLALNSLNIRLEWPFCAKQGFIRTLNSIWVIGGALCPAGKYMKTQNVDSAPSSIGEDNRYLNVN